MTAVQDIQSYGEIAALHAEGIKRFLPAFEALYASMPEAQKQQADALFRQRLERHALREPHAPRG